VLGLMMFYSKTRAEKQNEWSMAFCLAISGAMLGVVLFVPIAILLLIVLRQAKLGKGGSLELKPFRGDPAGNQSRPGRAGQQPEASLAWSWGDPSCEA
jgi:hypothetical protein